jgi:hypothetical protein
MAIVHLRRLLVLGVLLCACPGRGLADVRSATTPAEERAAFAALARAGGVSFTAFDAAGRQLDLAGEQWWQHARSIRLGAGGETIEHRLLEPANVLELMGE